MAAQESEGSQAAVRRRCAVAGHHAKRRPHAAEGRRIAVNGEQKQPIAVGLFASIAQQGVALFALLREAWTEYERDNARYLATAMIYYAFVSLVPLLLLLLAALGLLLRYSMIAAEAQQQVLRSVEASFGAQLRIALEQLLTTLQQESIIATIVSLVGLVLTASVLFRHLRLSFRAIWKHAPTLVSGPVRVVVRATFLEQLKAFLMVLTGGGLLLVAIIVTAVTQWLAGLIGYLPLLSTPTNWLLAVVSSLGLTALTFALLFKFLPPVTLRWRQIALAAVLCAAGWTIAGEVLALYGVFFGNNRSTFGAVGGLLVIMLWINIMSQMLFFGAEVCKVVVMRDGLRVSPQPAAGMTERSQP